MHLCGVTFRVGDFGTKQMTIQTEERAYAGLDADGNPRGGFAEVEFQAFVAAQSETNGWPTPIDLVSIEYVDEVSVRPTPAPKGRKQ